MTASDVVAQDIFEIAERLEGPLKKLEGKEVLISGACGFLGSWFIALFDYLNTVKFTKPCTVYGIDSFIAADKDKLNSIVKIKSDSILFRKDDISQLTFDESESVDYIIHAAGIASPVYYRQFPIETIDGMVLGLSNLLKFSVKHPVQSFLYFSSSEMYGNPYPEFVPTKEYYNGNVSCLGPRSCYDESKRMGETMCVAYHKVHSVPVKWVRPFNVYGPGMRLTDDRVIPKFMFQMLHNQPVTVHVPGTQTRTFCYVTDAMVGFLGAMLEGKDGQVYNVGNNTPELAVDELAKIMRKELSPQAVIEEIEMPPEYPRDQAQRRCPDIAKAKQDFGYKPTVNLEEGLKRMWDWAKEQV